MTTLRQKMIQDIQLRRYSPRTQVLRRARRASGSLRPFRVRRDPPVRGWQRPGCSSTCFSLHIPSGQHPATHHDRPEVRVSGTASLGRRRGFYAVRPVHARSLHRSDAPR